MSTGTKHPYAAALARAEELVTLLAPHCERTLIAGSIRRQKDLIGDIELVVQPNIEKTYDMFGDVVGERSLLDDALGPLSLTFTKNGSRYKQFAWQAMNVDLFIASATTWPCIATIRTGSAAFSQWLMTERAYGGAKPRGYQFDEGRLLFLGKVVDLRTEMDLFDALDLAWIPPAERTEGRWRR